MCGISAWITRKTPNKKDFTKYNDSIAHRGPDAKITEYYELNNTHISFGNRILSIIDLK